MSAEENTNQIMATENVDWQITPGPDGKFPDAQVTHALLKDIRESARSMRKMLVFFTMLVIAGCILQAVWLVVQAWT
jgi:hypothetical protein